MDREIEMESQIAISLPQLRKRLGRSQAEIAGVVGTTQSGISRIERQPDIHVSTLNEYVAALGARLRLIVEHQGVQTEIQLPSLQNRTLNARREYRVIWQDPKSRALLHVAWLEFTGDEFVFSYTQDVRSNPSFKPFPSFPVLDKTYRSKALFPFFALRLISAADPRFDAVLDALGLTRGDATSAELLARSPSDSPHDTIQVVPEPTEMPDGTLVRVFLVSGVRHAHHEDPMALDEVVAKLEPGTPMGLRAEPVNPSNPRALQLTVDDRLIGWVPDYLIDEVSIYLESKRELAFSVERANGPEAPWHLRLLCRLTVSPITS